LAFILNNPLYKGAIILGSGTAIAQMIGILTMPIITRLYSPSDLGVLAVYSSLLAIVGIGATLKYDYAIPLPKEEEDASNLFGLCLILLSVTTAVFAIILLFGGDFLIQYFDLSSIGQYFWFLLVGFFGMGLYTILNYWAVRQRDYERITYTKINQGMGGSISKIILGILSFGPMGLIIGHIVSQIAGIGTLARAMWKRERENLKNISIVRMMSVAKKYKSFPIFNFPTSIINTIALSLPPIILLALYDSQTVGFYALAHMIIVLPGSVISGSMGQAYLGEVSKMAREGSQELRSLYVRTLKHLSIIGIPLIGIPALCAPFLIPVIFGEAWAEAGGYCWPLAFMVIANFVASPTSLLSTYGYNHWLLMFDVTRTIGVFIGFYICYLFGVSVLTTLIIYSAIISLMYIVTIKLNLKAISNFTTSVKSSM
jgi:O-antigen/teichoic acid export membrane protein